MRRLLLTGLLLVTLLGCAAPPGPAPAATPAPAALRILNWETYIDPALLDQFSAQTGAQVVYRTYTSSEELYSAMLAEPRGYDLIIASDFLVERMRREGRLAVLDQAAIANLGNLDPLFASPAYDPGNRHCVPYLWGTLGFGYRPSATGRPIESWADFFDPAFAGRVALLDDSRYMLSMVLLGIGHSPNSTDPAAIGAARDLLRTRSPAIARFVADSGQDLLASGEVDIVLEWSGDILQLAAADADIAYAVPIEGSIVATDAMCVPAGAAGQALAEQFIDFILQPEVGAALARHTRYSTPNQAARALLPAEPTIDQAAARDRLFFLVDVGPAARQLYSAAWAEVLR